ncbi:hypothetical protein [Nostoc sp. TCL240-02]|uniref:hypothetical protein n=1 Tax=Nostoc sp. TCL240-02 TaxID=2572090 RepID=UPI0020C6F772|nr:hypothetical protein [Nostoc sp. TCL240-02]
MLVQLEFCDEFKFGNYFATNSLQGYHAPTQASVPVARYAAGAAGISVLADGFDSLYRAQCGAGTQSGLAVERLCGWHEGKRFC